MPIFSVWLSQTHIPRLQLKSTFINDLDCFNYSNSDIVNIYFFLIKSKLPLRGCKKLVRLVRFIMLFRTKIPSFRLSPSSPEFLRVVPENEAETSSLSFETFDGVVSATCRPVCPTVDNPFGSTYHAGENVDGDRERDGNAARRRYPRDKATATKRLAAGQHRPSQLDFDFHLTRLSVPLSFHLIFLSACISCL